MNINKIADLLSEAANKVLLEFVVKEDDGWVVYNHDKTKKLSKPYTSKKEATKRLRQIEFFKHKGE